MVEKTADKKIEESEIDFYINASDLTDITLNEEESEKLMKMFERGPNERAKNFSREAIAFHENVVDKSRNY